MKELQHDLPFTDMSLCLNAYREKFLGGYVFIYTHIMMTNIHLSSSMAVTLFIYYYYMFHGVSSVTLMCSTNRHVKAKTRGHVCVCRIEGARFPRF